MVILLAFDLLNMVSCIRALEWVDSPCTLWQAFFHVFSAQASVWVRLRDALLRPIVPGLLIWVKDIQSAVGQNRPQVLTFGGEDFHLLRGFARVHGGYRVRKQWANIWSRLLFDPWVRMQLILTVQGCWRSCLFLYEETSNQWFPKGCSSLPFRSF